MALRNPPAESDLRALPGVNEVSALAAGRFRLYFDPAADPVDALVRAAVDRGWGLRELAPVETSLEEVFVHLTQREDEPPAAAEGSA